MHMGMRLRGGVYVLEDVFAWLAETINKLDGQVCGFVEGRILMRYLNSTEPLTFDSGQCFAYQWFERPENPTCPR